MHAVVLAAGMGARLGPRGRELPKPCVVVGGKPLLVWTLEFLHRVGVTSIAVVTGHRAQLVAALARTHGASELVVNEAHATAGNLRSLLAAEAAGALRFPLLLCNADHIYSPGIAVVVAAECARAGEVTAFVDRDRTLGADDMKVQLGDGGAVRAIGKTLSTWDVGYVGATFVPSEASARYLEAAADCAAKDGAAAHVESILARLAGSASPPRVADVSGIGWWEIDDEADLARADAALAHQPGPASQTSSR